MSKYFNVEDFFDENGNVRLTEQAVNNLMMLSEIVMNTHYSYARSEKDDLRSVGVSKALSLLEIGTFDPKRSSLKNYLYTGMRNEMKNYLYKLGREVPVDDEVLIGANQADVDSPEDVVGLVDVSDSVIISGLGRLYTPVVFKKVAATLNYMGFITSVKLVKNYPEVSKEVALVIWKKIK